MVTMKVPLVLSLIIITATGSFSLDLQLVADGWIKQIDRSCPLLLPLPQNKCTDKISYWLYTRSSKKEGMQLIADNLDSTLFVEAPLKVIIHGYQNDRNSVVNKVLRTAYFNQAEYNIISVDWSQLCQVACYYQAVRSIPKVSSCVAEFLDLVVQSKHFKNVHILGHSLGAHVSAWTSSKLNFKVDRLTRFDPALPLFRDDTTVKGVADFIDVYHSNCGYAGQTVPEGHVDVYFNDGSFQPGCKCDLSCSHRRCVEYFARSVNMHMVGVNYSNYLKNKDKAHERKQLVTLGHWVKRSIRGSYLVFTRPRFPFLFNIWSYTSKKRFFLFKKIAKTECSVTSVFKLLKDWLSPPKTKN